MVDKLPERRFPESEASEVEILPRDIGDLAADQAAPLLKRAASRIEILKPKGNEFWQGVRENLQGASHYIEAKKSEVASKTFRLVAGGSLVTTMVAACAPPPETPETPSYPEPTATQVQTEPTVSPEVIEDVNQSAKSVVDREFEGVGITEVSLIGAGFLEDTGGKEYGLFTSNIKDRETGEAVELLLLGEVSGNEVESIKGLVLDEADQGPEFEFFGVSYDPEKMEFVIEGELLRMSTETGKIELQADGQWEELRGPDETYDSVHTNLGQGVLAAPRLNDLTPTPEPTATPEPSPTPEPVSPLDEQVQQEVIQEFMSRPEYQNYETFEDVMDGYINGSEYDPSVSWYGLSDKVENWNHGRKFMLIGSRDIPTSHLPGAKEGDYVTTLFLADPRIPGRLVPAIIAVNKDGAWAMTTTITDDEHSPVYNQGELGGVPIENESDLDNWTEANIGHTVMVVLLLRFGEVGGWSEVHNGLNPLYDPPQTVKDLMEELPEDVYFKKYTRDPESLGPPMPSRGGSETPGEKADLLEVLISLDPEIDIGFFASGVNTKVSRYP